MTFGLLAYVVGALAGAGVKAPKPKPRQRVVHVPAPRFDPTNIDHFRYMLAARKSNQ